MSLTRSKKIKGLIKKAEKCLIVNDILTAEALSREIIKFDPKNAEAYYFLGEALCKHRRFEEAIRVLKQADELLPNHPRIIHLLGWKYL